MKTICKALLLAASISLPLFATDKAIIDACGCETLSAKQIKNLDSWHASSTLTLGAEEGTIVLAADFPPGLNADDLSHYWDEHLNAISFENFDEQAASKNFIAEVPPRRSSVTAMGAPRAK